MTVTLEIDTKELMRFIDDLDKADNAVMRRANRTMTEGLIVFQQLVTGETPKNFGHLQQSISFSINGTTMGLAGEVATELIYGWPMERGRRPGKFPPIEAIQLWVERKRIATGKEARGVAFVIARAIARGTSRHQRKGGDRMFQKGFDQGAPIVEKLWIDMADEVVRDLAA